MKNSSTVDSRFDCPKCRKVGLRPSVALYPKQGREFFCDFCHEYFGMYELMDNWGFHSNKKFMEASAKIAGKRGRIQKPNMSAVETSRWIDKKDFKSLGGVSTNWYEDGYVFTIDEPTFKNLKDKKESYEVVTEMQLGIPAWATEQMALANDWDNQRWELRGGL